MAMAKDKEVERDVSKYASKMKLGTGKGDSHPPIRPKHIVELMRDAQTHWNGKTLPHEAEEGEDPKYHEAVKAFRDCYEDGESGEGNDKDEYENED